MRRTSTTPGYTDRYPAFFHGQNIDITGVPNGTYVLTHRVNASMQLRELRYDNDAASVLLSLHWQNGMPYLRVLAQCEDSARCTAPSATRSSLPPVAPIRRADASRIHSCLGERRSGCTSAGCSAPCSGCC